MLLSDGTRDGILDLLFMVLFLVPVILSWRVLRPSYALLATVLFVLTLSAGKLSPMKRYDLEIFPAFIALAALAGRYPLIGACYIAISVPLLVFFMLLFTWGGWVA